MRVGSAAVTAAPTSCESVRQLIAHPHASCSTTPLVFRAHAAYGLILRSGHCRSPHRAPHWAPAVLSSRRAHGACGIWTHITERSLPLPTRCAVCALYWASSHGSESCSSRGCVACGFWVGGHCPTPTPCVGSALTGALTWWLSVGGHCPTPHGVSALHLLVPTHGITYWCLPASATKDACGPGSGHCRSAHGVLPWRSTGRPHTARVPRWRAVLVAATAVTPRAERPGLPTRLPDIPVSNWLASWGTYPGRLPTWADPNPLQSNSHGPAVTAVTALSDLCLEPEPRTGTECRPNFLGPPAPPQWEPRRSRYLVSPGRDPTLIGICETRIRDHCHVPLAPIKILQSESFTYWSIIPRREGLGQSQLVQNCPGKRQGDGLTGGSETTSG